MSFKLFRETETNALPLVEAVFSEKNIEKAIHLMSRIIEKKFGSKFYSLGFEDFKSTLHGVGKGYRLINQSNDQLRFNWSPKDKGSFEISSMDYWKPDNFNFNIPSLSVKFGPDLNIIMSIEEIITALKRNKTGNFTISSYITENIENKIGKLAEYNIFVGKPEENIIISELENVEQEYVKLPYANKNTLFNDIEDLISAVGLGYHNSLIVAGGKDFSKEFSVNKKLNETLGSAGNKWVYFKDSNNSALELYKNIFLNRDKLLIFDNSDSLLADKDSLNIFKDLLKLEKVKEVSLMTTSETVNVSTMSKSEYTKFVLDLDNYIKENPSKIGKENGKLPSKIDFTGRVIIISNKQSSFFDDGFKSNSLFVDVNLHQQDVLRRIKSTLTIKDGFKSEEIDEIIDTLTPDKEKSPISIQYITPAYLRNGKNLTIRATKIASIFKKAKLPNWAELASMYA